MNSSILKALPAVVPLLEKVAPTIATAVGGPLAGTALTFLEKALCHSGGKVLPGLVRRRAAEAALFRGETLNDQDKIAA